MLVREMGSDDLTGRMHNYASWAVLHTSLSRLLANVPGQFDY